MISVIHGNAANILSMTGHQSYLAKVFFSGQILNLTLTILLIQEYRILGVALATLISSAIVDIVFVQKRASNATGIPMFTFYQQTVFPVIIPSGLMCAGQYGL